VNGFVPGRKCRKKKGIVTEDAVTGLEIVILLAVMLIIGIHVTFNVLSTPPPPPRHIGLLPATLRQDATQLNVYGSVAGFSAVNGPVGTTMVWRSSASPDRLGGVGMTLSIFTGSSGGVDMAGTAVLWTDSTGTETISLTREQTVICPNWTIYRHNIDPAKPADDDDILEPGELFDVFACPSKTYAPYESFTVAFEPPGGGPHFPVICTVPFPIKPAMEL
jgi:hypothetical protein